MNGPILPGERLAAIRVIPVPAPTGATLPTLPPSPSHAQKSALPPLTGQH
jgi:hypothetical protein